jgi:hypothetical protein
MEERIAGCLEPRATEQRSICADFGELLGIPLMRELRAFDRCIAATCERCHERTRAKGMDAPGRHEPRGSNFRAESLTCMVHAHAVGGGEPAVDLCSCSRAV